jgi:hypothetical protein
LFLCSFIYSVEDSGYLFVTQTDYRRSCVWLLHIQVYLMEDALDLWSCTLRYAPQYTPGLHQCFSRSQPAIVYVLPEVMVPVAVVKLLYENFKYSPKISCAISAVVVVLQASTHFSTRPRASSHWNVYRHILCVARQH